VERGQVKATELLELLNSLSPGDMVRLTKAQFATVFGTHGCIDKQMCAATDVADRYSCDIRFIRGSSAFFAVFTRRQA
jgi:hypothetical protein